MCEGFKAFAHTAFSGAGLSFSIAADDDFLVAAAAVSVTDVNPAGLHDELVVGQVVADVHVGLGHEGGRDLDVGCLTEGVLALADTAHEVVDTGLAIAAGDAHGHLEVLAEGLKDMLTEEAEVTDDFVRRLIGNGVPTGGLGAGELVEGEMFCQFTIHNAQFIILLQGVKGVKGVKEVKGVKGVKEVKGVKGH